MSLPSLQTYPKSISKTASVVPCPSPAISSSASGSTQKQTTPTKRIENSPRNTIKKIKALNSKEVKPIIRYPFMTCHLSMKKLRSNTYQKLSYCYSTSYKKRKRKTKPLEIKSSNSSPKLASQTKSSNSKANSTPLKPSKTYKTTK